QEAIGSFRDVADAPIFSRQQIFLAYYSASIQPHANDPFAAQASEKEVVFELRKGGAAIEHSAGRCNRGRVFQQRALKPCARHLVMNQGPAIVLPLFDDVYLVASTGAIESTWTMLRLKHEISAGLPVEALGIAMIVRPNFRAH